MVFLATIDVHLPDAGFIAGGLAEVAELAHGGDGYPGVSENRRMWAKQCHVYHPFSWEWLKFIPPFWTWWWPGDGVHMALFHHHGNGSCLDEPLDLERRQMGGYTHLGNCRWWSSREFNQWIYTLDMRCFMLLSINGDIYIYVGLSICWIVCI